MYERESRTHSFIGLEGDAFASTLTTDAEAGLGVTGPVEVGGGLLTDDDGVAECRACPFNFILCANRGSSTLEAEETGEIARSSSATGDWRDGVISTSPPFDLGGVCGSEVSAGVAGTVEL